MMAMLQRVRQRHWAEITRLARFVFIGGLSFLLYTGLYALMSRVIWVHGNRTLENFSSTVLASIFNFLAHRRWTFASHAAPQLAQAWRYTLVMVSATLLQSLLFWLGHEVLKIYDFAVIIVTAVLIPFYTYFMHRIYTFKLRPGPTPPLGEELDQTVL